MKPFLSPLLLILSWMGLSAPAQEPGRRPPEAPAPQGASACPPSPCLPPRAASLRAPSPLPAASGLPAPGNGEAPGSRPGREFPCEGAWHWSGEIDLLPLATGGGYASLAGGRGLWRGRGVLAQVQVPEGFQPRGWKGERIQATALLVDRFFRTGFTGPWVGGGLEHWRQRLESRETPGWARLETLQGTLGAGWVFQAGSRFTLNPWAALHVRMAGDTSAAAGSRRCRPRALQGEISLKLGWRFR